MLVIDVLIGCVAGILIGATGIGAGSVLTPLLILRGHDPLIAVTTGLVALVAAKSVGSFQHVIGGHWPSNNGTRILIGGLAGASVGYLLVGQLARTAFFQSAVRVSLGAVLLSVATAGALASRFRIRVALENRGRIMLAVAVATGAAVATTSAGSGTLLATLVFPATRWSVRELSAVSNVFGLLTGLIGIAAYTHFDNFDAGLLGHVTGGALAGIVFGVLLSKRIPAPQFSVAVRVLTIALGLGLIFTPA